MLAPTVITHRRAVDIVESLGAHAIVKVREVEPEIKLVLRRRSRPIVHRYAHLNVTLHTIDDTIVCTSRFGLESAYLSMWLVFTLIVAVSGVATQSVAFHLFLTALWFVTSLWYTLLTIGDVTWLRTQLLNACHESNDLHRG